VRDVPGAGFRPDGIDLSGGGVFVGVHVGREWECRCGLWSAAEGPGIVSVEAVRELTSIAGVSSVGTRVKLRS
jgi:ribosomal protein S5